MLEQQCLQTEVDSTQAAICQVAATGQPEKRNVPSYLEAAPAANCRIRRVTIPTGDADLREGSLVPDRTAEKLLQNEEYRDEQLAGITAQTIASTLAAQTAQTANGPSAPTDLRTSRVARLKLDNPTKFDGKPKTSIRTWWDSVCDYISISKKMES